jgi:hypothetical protein
MRDRDPLELSLFDHLARAFLGARVLLQAAVFIALIAGLRMWGPVEIQVKIASLTEVPLTRTTEVMRDAWGQATNLARTVEHSVGWRSQPAQQTAPSTF